MKASAVGFVGKVIRAADLFAGAGGTSTGALEAMRMMGLSPELTAINHWEVAVATHRLNHPGSRALCTGVDEVNPRDLFGEGELDFLWASPECTHHSIARGGKPINDQSRSTAWCVVRWAESRRPPIIMVENVPEFRWWGPLKRERRLVKYKRKLKPGEAAKRGEVFHSGDPVNWNTKRGGVRWVKGQRWEYQWQPIQERKGEVFMAWIGALRAIGYKVDWRVLSAKDYGDPTRRERLFVQAVLGKKRIVWPEPTHSERGGKRSIGCWPIRTGMDVIDRDLKGTLLTDRKRPLVPKTMRRIYAGFFDSIGVKVDLDAFMGAKGCKVGEVLMHEGKPYMLELRGTKDAQCDTSGKSIDQPVGAVTSGGGHHVVVDPVIVAVDHQSGNGGWPADQPVTTVTAKQRHALAEPYFIPQHSGGIPRLLTEPCPTLTTTSRGVALVEPYVTQVNRGEGKGGCDASRRVKRIDECMPAICCRNEFGVVHVDASADCVGKRIASVEPFIVEYYGTGGAVPLKASVPTVTTRDRFALVLPLLTFTDGSRVLVNFRFRMFTTRELARVQGFREDYQFSGSKEDQVAQIGNAVPRRLARALVLAALSQKSDIREWVKDEEDARVKRMELVA